MPKIKEYGAPNLEFQGSPQESSARLSNSGDYGRALQNFGESVDRVGDMVYRRQEQEETSKINADFAELSAQSTEEIDQGTREGTIDSQKYSESLQKQIDGMNENISTRAGRMAFERNAARLKSMAFKRASRGQAAVAGATAVANKQTELNSHAQALMVDPSEFFERRQAMMDSIDDDVATGVIKSPADAERMRKAARNNLAEASIRGWARLNPDIAEKKLYSGQMGDLDSTSLSQMQDYIDKVRVKNSAEESRIEAASKRAEKAAGDAWMAKNLHEIASGKLDSNKILDAPGLKPEFKLQLLKKVQQFAKDGGGIDNPAVVADLHSRMLLPPEDPRKIVDESQFVDKIGNGLSWKGFEEASRDLQKTDDAKNMRSDKKSALDVAKAEILQQGFSAFGGSKYSADSQRQLQNYINDARRAEKEQAKAGKPISSLYDPKSPDYIASPEKLKKYKTPFKPALDAEAQEMLKKQPAFQPGAERPAAKFKSIEEYEKSKAGAK